MQLFCKLHHLNDIGDAYLVATASATVSESSTPHMITINPVFDRPVHLKRNEKCYIHVDFTKSTYFHLGKKAHSNYFFL